MPRKIPGPKINPQKSHAEFPSLKNYQALHCKRYNPKDNNSRERGKKKPLQNYVAGKRRHYHESSHFFE